jgi:UTP--glucose-1-phosphate uridylyltransferase
MIQKAIITAAAPSQRTLPLQSLIDRDGIKKTVLQIIVEEVLSAGVNEIAIIVAPGDESIYATAIQNYTNRVRFIAQTRPKGYGNALLQAREFVAGERFLHLVGDHLHTAPTTKTCTQQLIEVAEREKCNVSAVQATREALLPYYGVVGGKCVPGCVGLYQIEHVLEKPSPTLAEQVAWVPGLRAGQYLCFFGMHVLNASIFDLLDAQQSEQSPSSSFILSPALNVLARQERYLAVEIQGKRFDVGVKYGLFASQLALALNGVDRDEVLAQLLELLATSR